MNRRLLTILLCAFFVAAGASFIVYRLVGKEINSKTTRQTAKVAFAARDLEIGTLIKASDLKMGDVVGETPKDAVLKLETAVGRGVVSTLYAGEPVMERRLAAVGSGGGLAATIPPGMRACAVKVDEVVGVAGFVVPGMRVDVIISGNNTPGETSTMGMRVKTLLQNLQVLSAGTNFQKDQEGKPVQVPVVNLLVTPEQAELLSLASNQTRIQLVLRNPLDTQFAKTPGTEMAGLFGGLPAKTQPAVFRPAASVPRVEKIAAPAVWVVQVINGSKETKENF
jgi:pilus assembly protein CpaB